MEADGVYKWVFDGTTFAAERTDGYNLTHHEIAERHLGVRDDSPPAYDTGHFTVDGDSIVCEVRFAEHHEEELRPVVEAWLDAERISGLLVFRDSDLFTFE